MAVSLSLLFQVSDALTRAGLTCHLFGGFAEEARGLRPPAPHDDIDLLLEIDTVSPLDHALACCLPAARPLTAKRFHHKRAFVLEGCLVELLLVSRSYDGACRTLFWGDTPHDWAAPLATPLVFAGRSVSVATAANLHGYRAGRARLQPERWRDPASIVPVNPGL